MFICCNDENKAPEQMNWPSNESRRAVERLRDNKFKARRFARAARARPGQERDANLCAPLNCKCSMRRQRKQQQRAAHFQAAARAFRMKISRLTGLI